MRDGGHTGEEDLVHEPVGLVEIEDEVKLADVGKVAVEDLDEEVDRVERQQLVVVGVDGREEVERRVALVDELERAPVDKVAELRGASVVAGRSLRNDGVDGARTAPEHAGATVASGRHCAQERSGRQRRR